MITYAQSVDSCVDVALLLAPSSDETDFADARVTKCHQATAYED